MTAARFPVEAGHVLTFRRAVGYPDSEAGADTTDVAVPPTFVQASGQFDPEFPMRPGVGPWWGSAADAGTMPEGRGGLHAEQHYTYHRPVRVGDVLSTSTRDGRTWEKDGRSGRLQFSELITEYRDQNGELVVTSLSVGVLTIPHE